MVKNDVENYQPIAEKDAKLRLYLNDPKIQEKLTKKLPVPIELEGKVVVARKGKQRHILFMHKDPNFIPVFIDYEGGF